ncbi:MAG TPA: DUF692 domain-containing protein [Gammaproteobacteria bacterium]|jgi:hypothetical protein|nr:hypothetical protein [Chromatiales bacterium]MCP4924616.1 DUF692 domain-containing protein [Gammaproteobacteria bacterium]MDP7296487.1 DUF692 domain-containing protein [Gammaproteobacteria bacterium]MDP7659865.1 DUF692 domain-containing protein [Gammaproteobacteria bacterium]HJP38609.1 DUF692 domain-containing protein [Gammaproteobacteria bacterium]
MARFPASPIAGAGLGLRSRHYREILDTRPAIPWFEVLSENYFGAGGLPTYHLERVRELYPVTLHGVGMSLGSADPLNFEYLARLKKLAEQIEPAHISDHLAWISIDGRHVHDLLPIPYTEEALVHFTERVCQVQDFLGCRLLIENPSSYMGYKEVDMTEWEFIAELVKHADCDLLFDVNNVYVSSQNHGFDPYEYLQALPGDRVREIHLAGYEEQDSYLFDTHGYRVHPPVWELYRKTIKHLGPVATLIEWDNDIPEFEVLVDEANKAQKVMSDRETAA